MDNAAIEAVRKLPPGYITVATSITVRHLTAQSIVLLQRQN